MKRLLLVIASAVALWSTACGGGGGTTMLPPPTGKYSAASLNGTYAFTTNGEVFVNNANAPVPLARVGSFIADGLGNIKGGIEDSNTAGSANTPNAITGGGYTVGADGRGSLTVNFANNSLTFGITLTSTSNGLMIDETFNANQASTGSGNFVKQDTTLCSNPSTSPSGTYVFDFSGADVNGLGESIVGEVATSGAVLTTGFADINDAGSTANGSITGGGLTVDNLNPPGPDACGRGLAQFNFPAIGSQSFVFYNVDATRIRLLTNANGVMLSGDAVLQPNPPAGLSGNFAFIVSGSTVSNGTVGAVSRVGRLTASGNSVSNFLMDTNNSTQFTSTTGATSASITMDPANPGRGTATILGRGLNTPSSFVFYMSSATQGVIQETIVANQGVVGVVADGSIGAQTGNPFSGANITGTYAMNWSGLSVQAQTPDEEDFIGQSTVSSLALTGAADVFEFQSIFLHNTGAQMDDPLSGSIVLNGDGTGDDTMRNTMAVKFSNSGQSTTVNFSVYFVNPQLAFFANNSGSRVVVGVLEAQQ